MATVIESTRLGGYITKFETTNFSPAKVAHSFAKDKRFQTVQRQRNQNIGYNLPSTLQKRTTNFGYGDRFTTPKSQRSCSPPPTKYDAHQSEFNIGNPNLLTYNTKGGIYSFGIKSEHQQKLYMPENKQQLNDHTPGPGTYDNKYRTLGSEGKKWKMQGRSKMVTDPVNSNIKQNVPGPGSYSNGVQLNKYGVYNLSIMENSRAARWSPNKKRFVDENRLKNKLPGPAEYYPSDYNNSIGYVLSNNINQGSYKMKRDHNLKNRKFNDQTPGPGSYMQPSDFGYLDMYKYANQSPRTSQSPRRTGTSLHQTRQLNSMAGSYRQSNMTNYVGTEQTSQNNQYAQKNPKKFKLRRNSNQSQMAQTYQGAIFNPNTASNYTTQQLNFGGSNAEKILPQMHTNTNPGSMTGASTPAHLSGR